MKIVLPLATGIAWVRYNQDIFLLDWWICLLICHLLLLLSAIIPREFFFVKSPILLLALVFAGMSLYGKAEESNQPSGTIVFLFDQEIDVVFHILGMAEKAYPWRMPSKIVAYKSPKNERWLYTSTPVSLYLRGWDDFEIPPTGTYLLARTKLRSVPENPNPHAFDYRRYLADQGVFIQASVSKKNIIDQIHSPKWHHVVRGNMRENGFAVLDYYFDDAALGIISALLLGYRTFLDPAVKESFADAGAIHVLAVSGLHVGILVFTLMLILKRPMASGPKGRVWVCTIIICVLAAYTEFTGSAPPVLRAALMFGILFAGTALGKWGHSVNFLSLAAFVLLTHNPHQLFQVSFQLSFCAVFSILFFYPLISSAYRFGNPFLNTLWKMIAISLAAQVLTFPLIVYYFHQFPTLFAITSIIAIFFAQLILYGGTLILVLHHFSETFTHTLAHILEGATRLLSRSMDIFTSLPYSQVSQIYVPFYQLVLLYGILLCLVARLLFGKRIYFFYALALTGLFFTCRTVKEIIEIRQIQFIHYESRHFFADVFIGRKAFEIVSGDLSTKDKVWAADNNRLAHGISVVSTLDLSLDAKDPSQ